MDASTVAVLSLGFVYGLRHALDPDHMVAVSTIVSEHKSVARSSLIGTFWGLGHTASLLVVGMAVLLLKISIPKQVGLWLEVAVMLVILGSTSCSPSLASEDSSCTRTSIATISPQSPSRTTEDDHEHDIGCFD
jgi:ABC-type nickel/cobalt efflux system permease component RcnA